MGNFRDPSWFKSRALRSTRQVLSWAQSMPTRPWKLVYSFSWKSLRQPFSYFGQANSFQIVKKLLCRKVLYLSKSVEINFLNGRKSFRFPANSIKWSLPFQVKPRDCTGTMKRHVTTNREILEKVREDYVTSTRSKRFRAVTPHINHIPPFTCYFPRGWHARKTSTKLTRTLVASLNFIN